MTGMILVGAVLALLAGAWILPGGDLRGVVLLLVAAEAVVLLAALGTAGAAEVGWDGAVGTVLAPYGVTVAAGCAVGAAVGRAARAGGRGDGPRR